MGMYVKRDFRNKSSFYASISVGCEEFNVIVKNISRTGILVSLAHEKSDVYSKILAVSLIDIHIPKLKLAGEMEAARIDINNDEVLLALKFKSIFYDIDRRFYVRKAYQSSMDAPGHILLGDVYVEFDTVKVSLDGLIIRLAEKLPIEKNLATSIEFRDLDMAFEITVIWFEIISKTDALVGLEFQ